VANGLGGPDAVDLGFELIPADDDDLITPEQQLAAAEAGAMQDPVEQVAEDVPQPFGMSWAYDWQNGQFILQGSSPAEVRELDALREWCLMAIYSARFAHAVFTDEFGLEDPDELFGEIDPEELVGDYEERLREALLVHDRIAAVENFDADWDPTEGVLTINYFDVRTDEDEAPLSLAGLRVPLPRGAT
jgi:hypothetical protein